MLPFGIVAPHDALYLLLRAKGRQKGLQELDRLVTTQCRSWATGLQPRQVEDNRAEPLRKRAKLNLTLDDSTLSASPAADAGQPTGQPAATAATAVAAGPAAAAPSVVAPAQAPTTGGPGALAPTKYPVQPPAVTLESFENVILARSFLSWHAHGLGAEPSPLLPALQSRTTHLLPEDLRAAESYAYSAKQIAILRRAARILPVPHQRRQLHQHAAHLSQALAVLRQALQDQDRSSKDGGNAAAEPTALAFRLLDRRRKAILQALRCPPTGLDTLQAELHQELLDITDTVRHHLASQTDPG